MFGSYPAPIRQLLEDARWSLAEHLYNARSQGRTYQELAEANGMHRATVRAYARTYEIAARRYGWGDDQAPSCNEVRLRCAVCAETFTASRADARYCSDACRQDAYRKRKLGATPTDNGSAPKGSR
jgi:hypothetical protein